MHYDDFEADEYEIEMTSDEVERRLAGYREQLGHTDEAVINLAEKGELHFDADYCAWLILLGRGDLIPGPPKTACEEEFFIVASCGGSPKLAKAVQDQFYLTREEAEKEVSRLTRAYQRHTDSVVWKAYRYVGRWEE